MTTCKDNARLGRLGCGAEFGGGMQHSDAKVSWSKYPDGRAHMTAKLGTIDACWAKGRGGEMVDPESLGFTQDARGVWRRPITDEQRARLAEMRAAS